MACGIPITNFHGGPFGARGRGGWGRGRHCSDFGPPAWLASRAGRPHHLFRRGPYLRGPWFNDIPHFWKAIGESPSWELRNCQLPPEWRQCVNCEGFTPGELTVKISHGKITVEGLHESIGFNGVSSEVRQMKRTIGIPENVDSEAVRAFVKPNGALILKAARKTREHETEMENESEDGQVCKENATESEPMDFQIILVGNGLGLPRNGLTDDSARNKSNRETMKDTTQVMEARESQGNKEKSNTTKIPCKSSDVLTGENDENETGEKIKTIYTQRKMNEEKSDVNVSLPKATEVKVPIEIVLTTEASSMIETPFPIGCESRPKLPEVNELSERDYKQELDMTKFDPETIEVKLDGSSLTVVGEQKEVDANRGNVSSRNIMMKTFDIPADVNSELLISKLNEGHLTISAPYRTNQKSA